MNRVVRMTADGSHTLFVPEIDEHYHSVNGAVQESRHVFLEAGLHQIGRPCLRVLEIGFGTGLNALLTLLDTLAYPDRRVVYYSIELHPLTPELVGRLNYGQLFSFRHASLFDALHSAPWDMDVPIAERFVLHKIRGDSNSCILPAGVDVVYFDAFAPDKQPEMWNQAVFDRLYSTMEVGGVLVTYCAKGAVRRMMKEAGYSVERISGPPGKREMLRARKPL